MYLKPKQDRQNGGMSPPVGFSAVRGDVLSFPEIYCDTFAESQNCEASKDSRC
jgi:hypothetical protein